MIHYHPTALDSHANWPVLIWSQHNFESVFDKISLQRMDLHHI